MTLASPWAPLTRLARPSLALLAAAWVGGCSLPRSGTNPDTSATPRDAGADTGFDAGPICEPEDCNDGNPCTDDLCTGRGCEHAPNTNACDDGVFCNGFDRCVDGVCSPSGDNPCSAPTFCDEPRHACVGCESDADCPADNVPDWSSCDFGGDPCVLSGGTHTRTVTSFRCDPASRECVSATRDESEGCSRPASDTDGASCAMGAATGECLGGGCCTGCLEGGSCHLGTDDARCGAGGRTCRPCGGATPRCAGSGRCVECTGDADCDDGNGNTTDTCIANVCFHECTGCFRAGSCVAGTTAADCGSAGGPCSSCGGGAPFCVAGGCVECRRTSDCDDGNPCTDDSCSGGSCVHASNSAACDDGNACTLGDRCSAGSCVSGAARDCDDGNPCTDDSCDTVGGACGHLPNTRSCDDGDPCTTGDRCGGGVCAGTAKSCDDGNPCTDDSCAASTGACAHTNNSRSCMGGAGVCGGGSCCTGCLSGSSCFPGGMPSACGAGGATCTPCVGSTPFCVSATCIQCRDAGDCSSPTAAGCSGDVCVPCSTNADCSNVVGLPGCDTGASPHTCVTCTLDAHCGSSAPRCNPASHSCVRCLTNADCPSSAPFCDGSYQCVECLGNGDCPGMQHCTDGRCG